MLMIFDTELIQVHAGSSFSRPKISLLNIFSLYCADLFLTFTFLFFIEHNTRMYVHLHINMSDILYLLFLRP